MERGKPQPLQLAENGAEELEDAEKSPVPSSAGASPKPITVKKVKVGHVTPEKSSQMICNYNWVVGQWTSVMDVL